MDYLPCRAVVPLKTKPCESVSAIVSAIPLRSENVADKDGEMVENHQNNAHAAQEIYLPHALAFSFWNKSDLCVVGNERTDVFKFSFCCHTTNDSIISRMCQTLAILEENINF